MNPSYFDSLTCFNPRCVKAEHSRYLTARILLDSFWPASRLIGDWLFSDNACNVSLSSRKSILVPVNEKNVRREYKKWQLMQFLSLPLTDYKDGSVWTVVLNLRVPFRCDVFE